MFSTFLREVMLCHRGEPYDWELSDEVPLGAPEIEWQKDPAHKGPKD